MDAEQKSETSDILDIDGRVHVLELDSLRYRTHLVKFEDALIGQIITVGFLELCLALFIAAMVWDNYRTKVNSGVS